MPIDQSPNSLYNQSVKSFLAFRAGAVARCQHICSSGGEVPTAETNVQTCHARCNLNRAGARECVYPNVRSEMKKEEFK